jgi:small subunit ribosomal protein S2e
MKPAPVQTESRGGDRPKSGGNRGERGRVGDRGDSGGRGRVFGRRRGRDGRGGKDGEEWTSLTKLGILVSSNLIKSLEDVYNHSIPIKEV